MTPPDVLPPALSKVAYLWPASHIMRVFRHTSGWGASAIVLALGAVLAFVSAAVLYEWDPKNQRPARYRLIAVIALIPFCISAVLFS
jgi:hypothetical protein